MVLGSQNKLQYPLLLILTFLLTACPNLVVEYNKTSAETGTNYSVFQEKVLEEINFARTNPVSYAETRLRNSYNTNSDNGAYNDIRNRTPVGPVELQSRICRAASKYAVYLAQHNVFGHYENSTPPARCQAEGYHNFSGENLAAGSYSSLNADINPETAAIEFVVMLIIDQGVPSLGHRHNIMNGVHKKLGVGFSRDTSSTYKNYTVHDFGSK